MTTTIDFDALQVSEGPRVTLLGNQEVGGGLVGDDFADFSSFASLSVDVKVQRMSSTSPPPLLTVLVEHSDDGLSWSTAETFTFTDDGEQTASLASPKAHVRARASGSGAEWYVKSVNVAPTSGGGGGSMPVTERGVFVGGDPFTTIGDGATDYLNWGDGGYPGGPVLDLTDPFAPAVLAAGIYDVTASVKGNSLTPDGCFQVLLILDANGDAASVVNESRLATAARSNVYCAVSCSYYIPEGGTIQVRVASFDGASARVFENFAVTVQRAT